MKIGILADIHEDVARLTTAIDACRAAGVDQFVTLGDIFEAGERVSETVELLTQAEVVGVWGNHDVGLCFDQPSWIYEKYPRHVTDFFATLKPRFEIDDLLFTHGAPCWDPTDPCVYYLGEGPFQREGLDACFESCLHRVTFIGHFHRWFAGTNAEILTWDGETELVLEPHRRHLIVVHAVMNGWCAVFDTQASRLTPCFLGSNAG